MSYNIIIQNNTNGSIVANGISITQTDNHSFQDSTVNVQIPLQHVLQVKTLDDDKVLISSSFYRNEIENNGQGITLIINQNFEFSVKGTAIQNVPLQTNRVADYPFLPLESTSLPQPWIIYPTDPFTTSGLLIKSLNSQELNFSATQQSNNPYGLARMPNVNPTQGVQLSFNLKVDAFIESNDSTNAIFLPESIKLSFDTNGNGAYYYNNDKLGDSGISIGNGYHSITIIEFSNSYVLIEDGKYLFSYEYPDAKTLTDLKFGCSTDTEDPSMNFTFSEFTIGTPQTMDLSEYAFEGIGNIWPDNYTYNSDYYSTNWVRCDHLIAAIQYDKNDPNNNQQVITIVDINTGEAITKETGYNGQAYRSPFVDDELKYICFPINNKYYFIYDLSTGSFSDAIDLGTSVEYSEEICYKGIIYYASYDNYWHIYNIATTEKSTKSFNTDNDIKRIVRPIVQDSVIFAAIYTEHKGTYTEIIAYTIATDGSLAYKWHKGPHDSSNTQIWSKYISYDNTRLYYWDANINLFAINLSDGSEAWVNGYQSKCGKKAYYFAPTTDQLGALYIIQDSGEIIALSPVTGKVQGASFNINECCLSAYIEIYPNKDPDHSPYSLCSIPKIVNGHYICQGNDSKTLYSVNLDTGIIQSSTLDSNCYVSNFAPNLMISSYGFQGVNLIQMQQYDKNFYFDSALMAEDYERDAKSDTVRPKTTNNSFYAVTLSLQSNAGIPIDNVVYIKNMGEQVTLISSVFEGENGEVTLAPQDQIAIKPGFDGKFKFKIPATSLYCPALHFWSDFMLPNVRVAFFANQSNVDVLRNQTAEDVLNAKSYVGLGEEADQCYVFEDDFRNEGDANLITQMIANSVGGSILDEEAQVTAISDEKSFLKSTKEKARLKAEKEEKIERRASIKQEVLTLANYTPNLTFDYCAFAEDSTDNCLCTNDPQSPIIDQPYLSNESTYTAGLFVIADDEIRSESQNIHFDADRDKIKWRESNRLFEEQLKAYQQEHPTLSLEDIEEDVYGFQTFVEECIKSDQQVQSYHWEPQDEGVQKGVKKVFHVLITAGKKVYRFVVNTMEQGLMVLESFFKQVAKSIIDVVQWLAWVLDWQDIINCQKNLSTCMSNNFQKGLDYFTYNQENWTESLDSFIDKAENGVDNAFNTAESAIGGYNMDDVLQDYKNPRTLTGEGGDNVTNQMDYFNDQLGLSTSQAELFQYKRAYLKYKQLKLSAKNEAYFLSSLHPKISRMIQLQEDNSVQDGLKNFFEIVGNEIDKYLHIFENLWTKLKGQIDDETFQNASDRAFAIIHTFRTKVNTAEEFLQTCVVTLLDLIKSFVDLALEAFRLVVTDLIQLIPEFISSVIAIMTKSINIPVVTKIWDFIVGGDEDDPLTVLNFMSLVLALPTTLGLKLLGYKDNIFLRENGIPPLGQEELTASDEREIIIGTSTAAGFAALYYAFCDTYIDLYEPEIDLEDKLAILFYDFAVIGLTFPTYTDTSSVHSLDYVPWAIGLVHWIGEVIFTVAPNPVQPTVEYAYGILFELFSTFALAEKLQSDFGDEGANEFLFYHQTVYIVPSFFKLLKYNKDPDTEWFTKGLLAGIDGLFGLGNGLMFAYYVKNA